MHGGRLTVGKTFELSPRTCRQRRRRRTSPVREGVMKAPSKEEGGQQEKPCGGNTAYPAESREWAGRGGQKGAQA